MAELFHLADRSEWLAAEAAGAVGAVLPVGRDQAGRLILPDVPGY